MHWRWRCLFFCASGVLLHEGGIFYEDFD